MAVAMLPVSFAKPATLAPLVRLWIQGTEWGLRRLCRISVEVRGREHVPAGAALIAAKHQCTYDAFAPVRHLGAPSLVAKKELLRVPFLALYGIRSGMLLPIDREGHASSLRKLISDARAALDQGRQLVIFPEGTRAEIGAAPDYKPGIAALYGTLDVPCVPMATNAGMHWRPGSVLHPPGRIVFEYLEPIPPGLDRRAFMRELQGRIEAATDALVAESRAALGSAGGR